MADDGWRRQPPAPGTSPAGRSAPRPVARSEKAAGTGPDRVLREAKSKEGVTMTEQSLYERLGGVNAIAMVVDRFSDRIIENPKLNVNPQLREWMERACCQA